MLLLLREHKRNAQSTVIQTALESLGMLEQDLPYSVALRCDVFSNLRMMLILPEEIRWEYTDVVMQTYRPPWSDFRPCQRSPSFISSRPAARRTARGAGA